MPTIKSIFDQATGEIIAKWRADRMIRKQYHSVREDMHNHQVQDESRQLLPVEDMLWFSDREDKRRSAIEEKAKSNLLAITLTITIMVASLIFLHRIDEAFGPGMEWGRWLFAVAQIMSIAFFVAGGWFALHALRVQPIHMWTLDEARTYKSIEAINYEIAYNIKCNSIVAIRKANSVEASYSCMRNGVIVMAVAVVFATVVATWF